ncbi:unnamed protein product [Ixodes hexagonus]
MSLDRPITECFKMKKPKQSPGKSGSNASTTPKRRAAKSKLASASRGLSTPLGKAGGKFNSHLTQRDASPDFLNQSCCEATVDLNTIADDLLCSQDVVAADVIWDCTSPRNKVVKVKKNGESDVKNLVKHFRAKPQVAKPTAVSVLDIIGTSYNHTPPRAKPERPRKQKNDAANAQVIMKEMQMLLDMMKQPMQNGTHTSCAKDIEEVETPARVEKSVLKSPSLPSSCDEDKWDGEDDSLLVAATQEIEMTAEMRTPSRPSKVAPMSSTAAFHTPPNFSRFVSPLRCRPNRPSPRDRSSLLRKSPRLQALSLNRTPSPLRRRSLVPVAATTTGEPITKSPGPVFDEDDEDEALLDQICSTYEQQQELERKMAGKSPLQCADGGTASTSSMLDKARAPNEADTTTLVRGVHTAASGLLGNVPGCGRVPLEVTSRVVVKTPGKANGAAVISGDRVLVENSGASSSCKAMPFVALPSNIRSKIDSRASSSIGASSKTTSGRSVTCDLRAPPPTLQPGVHNNRMHAGGTRAPTSVVSSGSNLWVVSAATMAGHNAVCNESKSSCVARPESSRDLSSAAEMAATRKPPTALKVKSPYRNHTKAPASKAKTSTAHSADTGIDFGDDDDDMDFTTPDVVSWLEKVESQRAPSQKCTPEEIARKREEALRRRQLKAAQAKHQWKGRLRPSR